MEGSFAQAGFYYQNNIAALKVLECLFFDSDIKGIRLENYDKGKHIDDIIVYRSEVTEFFQVKWSADEETTYTLYNLLTPPPSPNGKSIFKQLAEGYVSAKSTNSSLRIILFSTKQESNGKRPSAGLTHGLSDMRKNVFVPLKLSDEKYFDRVDFEKYNDTLEMIRHETQLDRDAFHDFLKSLEFKFNQASIENVQESIKAYLDRLGIERNLFERLLDAVVKWSISGGEITKAALLKELGIADRFDDKISNHFRVIDEEFYVDNVDLSSQLDIAINSLNGGYVLIEGQPGSGKSTALVKFKESNPEITLAYYCFIPDAPSDFGNLRHKAEYFLKSLCISIEKAFPDVELPIRYSDRYEEKLNSYINKLGQLNNKVVIIVDGLDHVHRQLGFNADSLLNQIKGTLPSNVFFVLSSQYKDALPEPVKLEIETDAKRYIKVPPFSQGQIHKYFANKGVEISKHLQQIEQISFGIPLYLHYISERLSDCPVLDYDEVIGSFPTLNEGEIQTYHAYLYNEIQADDLIKWIFSLLAFRREKSTIDTILNLLRLADIHKSEIDIEPIIRKYSYLLRESEGRSYSIFHNSFREFVISKNHLKRDVYSQLLIRLYEDDPHSDEAYRNYFRHLYETDSLTKIVSFSTLEWIKKAWQNYRPLYEIRDNIDISLQACIDLNNIDDFIRIGFLRAQVDRVAWNIQHSEVDFSLFYLRSGLKANSIREIWDGDFVLTSKEGFAHYLNQYFEFNKELLPSTITKQGFSKAFANSNSESFLTYFKAKALVEDDITSLLRDIESLTWVDSNKHQVSFKRKIHSDEENKKINNRIKRKLIRHLFEQGQLNKLQKIAESDGIDDRTRSLADIYIARLILPIEVLSAMPLINGISDWSSLPKKDVLDFVNFCANHLDKAELLLLISKVNIPEIQLDEHLIDKGNIHRYYIKDEIINLFESLKPVWVSQPNRIDELEYRISSMKDPERSVYLSIFKIFRLWCLERTNKISEATRITYLKEALKLLNFERENSFRKSSFGLFDSPIEDGFVTRSVYKLYRVVFNYATKVLEDEKSVVAVVNHWFDMEADSNGFKDYQIALTIGHVLHLSHFDLKEEELKLFKHSEELARYNEETFTLFSNLANVAEAYGNCGSEQDFKRVYNQLFEVAFGIDERKDYQASSIIEALKAMHHIDATKTLERLGEILFIQSQLAFAGNGRINHICLSEIIAFICKYFPDLGFKLLKSEERSLIREETIEMISKGILDSMNKDDLIVFFTLVKTFPRWESETSYRNGYDSLIDSILRKAIELKAYDLIEAIVIDVRHVYEVEREQPEGLKAITKIFIELNEDYSQYSLPDIEKEVSNEEQAENRTNRNKSEDIPGFQPIEQSKLLQLVNTNDIINIKRLLGENFTAILRSRRIASLKSDYLQLRNFITEHFNNENGDQPFNLNVFGAQRVYVSFVTEILSVRDERISKNVLLDLSHTLIDRISALHPEGNFVQFLETNFDIDKWLDNLQGRLNDRREFVLSNVITEDIVLSTVENASILSHNTILEFIEEWTEGEVKLGAKLALAKRLYSIKPVEAKVLFEQLTFNTRYNLFSEVTNARRKSKDIIEYILKVDEEFATTIILKSCLTHWKDYNSASVYDLEKLLRFATQLKNDKAVKIYYESNLRYNKELAEGLEPTKNNYTFIVEHTEELTLSQAMIRYLVQSFDYPPVKVRELILKSLFELFTLEPSHLQSLIKYGLLEGNDNQVEYTLTLLQSIALKSPEVLLSFKNELLGAIVKPHFNIVELAKELLLLIELSSQGFLSDEEKNSVLKANSKSLIILDSPVINAPYAKGFIFSEYQSKLLYDLHNDEDDESEFTNDVYADLVRKKLGDYNSDKEGSVHRTYNINTNFATIEINTSYFDEVKSSINRVLYQKNRRGCFALDFISETKYRLRLHDPSKSLTTTILRPSYINWLPNNIDENEFIEFQDIEDVLDAFSSREEDFITLYEIGQQRPGNKSTQKSYASTFEVIAYLKQTGADDSILEDIDIAPYVNHINQYSYELPHSQLKVFDFPLGGIVPLLEISYSHFRGQYDLATASIIKDASIKLGFPQTTALGNTKQELDNGITSFYWQNAFTNGTGYRRYKPTSEGFTLKIKKSVLMDILSANNLELCYEVKLGRMVEEYKSPIRGQKNQISRRITVNL